MKSKSILFTYVFLIFLFFNLAAMTLWCLDVFCQWAPHSIGTILLEWGIGSIITFFLVPFVVPCLCYAVYRSKSGGWELQTILILAGVNNELMTMIFLWSSCCIT